MYKTEKKEREIVMYARSDELDSMEKTGKSFDSERTIWMDRQHEERFPEKMSGFVRCAECNIGMDKKFMYRDLDTLLYYCYRCYQKLRQERRIKHAEAGEAAEHFRKR